MMVHDCVSRTFSDGESVDEVGEPVVTGAGRSVERVQLALERLLPLFALRSLHSPASVLVVVLRVRR